MISLKIWLFGYNVWCCSMWTLVFVYSVMTIQEEMTGGVDLKTALSNVYNAEKTPFIDLLLWNVQMAAVLEIFHSAFGLVRSPLVVTFLQVASRIWALLAVTYSPNAQEQWGAGVMILSWSLVEIFRYMFYAFAIFTNDSTKETPLPLFWLRYSLFAILYPTGITGELTCFWNAAYDPQFATFFFNSQTAAIWIYARILLVIYAFGSPFMIYNMMMNRKSAFKKRYAKPEPAPKGIVFPKDKKGIRSSTIVNKELLATAVGVSNPEKAKKIRNEKDFRYGYVKHIIGLVEEQCQTYDTCLKIAQAGLDKAYDTFEFIAPDGTAVSVRDAMSQKISEKFYTGFIQGQSTSKATEMEIPYRGTILKGQALKDQVKKWVDYGTIEPSAGEAIIGCVNNPKWCDLSNRYFVLLGAGSAMGPLDVLLSLGANVIGIDLDRPQIWKKLIEKVRISSGTLTFPLKQEQSKLDTDDKLYANAGCNLFTHTPMIRDWLMNLYPGENFTVGSYAYLNGALHVQVSLAMDAIVQDLSENRPGTSLAYLCTPTDLHLVPKEAWDASVENYKKYNRRPLCAFMRFFTRELRKNAKGPVSGEGGDYYMINGVTVAQGPNYIVAKRMQHWRAIIARSKGCIVSSNIAPATATVSVTQNKTFAWAYEGMPYFEPYEIFAPETSNAVMSAILFSDLNNPKSSGNPKTKLNNPNQLFSYGSFNGGNWRCAYECDSIGVASVLIYFYRIGQPYLAVVGVVVLAAIIKVSGFI